MTRRALEGLRIEAPSSATRARRMTRLTRYGIFINGLFPCLRRIVDGWVPGMLGSEKEFRNSLFDHLRRSLPPDCRIEKEYRDGGTTCDLYLKWPGRLAPTEVFFELKHNLKRKTDFDRLVGQIHGLEPSKRKIIVVLCGATDEALLGRLNELFKNQLNDESVFDVFDLLHERNLRIIRKVDLY